MANAIPRPPGQVREKCMCWCCSRHGQPSGGGPGRPRSPCPAARPGGAAPRVAALPHASKRSRAGIAPAGAARSEGKRARDTPGRGGPEGSRGARRDAPPSPLRWEWVFAERARGRQRRSRQRQRSDRSFPAGPERSRARVGSEAGPWGETHRGGPWCEEPEPKLFWQRQPKVLM